MAGAGYQPGGDGSGSGGTGPGVPAGGTAGQILEKIDGTNFNTQWINNTGGSPFDPDTIVVDIDNGTIVVDIDNGTVVHT